MARIVVVGGGIGGLAVSLFLGRRGHQVTVLEKDGRKAGGDLESDFFDWHRPGVPQAVQPHTLHAPVRMVLRAEAPDVYEAMLRLGAEEWHAFDDLPQHPPALPGDEELVTLRARRIVVERALTDAAGNQRGVTIRQGEPATGLTIDDRTRPPRITGVHCAAGPLAADLVIDAAGRRSPIPRWLSQTSPRAPVLDGHRAGIAYFCRWYRLRPAADRPRPTVVGSSTSFALGGVFPSDNGVFAAHLVVSTDDPTRSALRDPAVFEAVVRTFPSCADWLALAHDPVGPVHVMAGLDNRRTALVDPVGPIVTGLLGIGDSVIHTNPTLGLGVPLALRTAAWVAANAARPADAELTRDHQRWITETLGPWFNHQVAADKLNERRLRDGPAFAVARRDPAEAIQAALPWCALDDPQVMRARARVRHLFDLPNEAYATPEIKKRVAEWLAARPDFAPPQQGPSRAQWEHLTTC